MKVLFISRAYPPVVGGIEKQNYELCSALARHCQVEAITNTRGKAFLPVFLPYAMVLALLKVRKADVVLLGDGVLAPLGYLLQRLFKKPVYCIIHGLDISFANRFYQWLVVATCLPRLTHVFAVGQATLSLAESKGISRQQLSFIPNGVKPLQASERPAFANELQKPFLLSLGRLIPRKGVVWFLENVFPLLDDDVQYLIAGDGPDKERIQVLCEKSPRTIYLGKVTDSEKSWLLNNAAIFIQSNIPVPNDIEGFGLVVLEAALSGSIVLASELEGLQDAIKNAENGFLIAHSNTDEWVKKIHALIHDKDRLSLSERFSAYTLQNYHWDSIAEQYIAHMSKAG